jgi:hypothetical protein
MESIPPAYAALRAICQIGLSYRPASLGSLKIKGLRIRALILDFSLGNILRYCDLYLPLEGAFSDE